ncbi:MAG: S8 family serine peptidase [Bdellovibrionales bacterium]|nr:S8 family serine peptidase [Bdellovibrionales bacterium]
MNMKSKLCVLTVSLIVIAYGLTQWHDILSNHDDEKMPASLGVIKGAVESTTTEKSVLMNDPSMKLNWGFDDSLKATINASKAWEITRGSKEIVVAVIDTGVDVNHPDIKNNLWTSKTGTHGWNFVANNADLTDNHGHGTHIAGIIGAEGGNGIGISGVAPKVSLMILKYYDPKAAYNNNLANTIKAIRYATENGANIINYSGGGLEFSKDEYDAINEARKKGILFVAAAGNEKSNSDKSRYYPANYDLDNIISVTAINTEAKVLDSSNYGAHTVHIAAPGKNIFSTIPGGKYAPMTGTSQATAFVSGVAALLLSSNRSYDYLQVKKQILSTADYMDELKDKNKTSGKLNSWAALAMQDDVTISGLKTTSQQRFFATTTDTTPNTEATTNITDLNKIIKMFEKQL